MPGAQQERGKQRRALPPGAWKEAHAGSQGTEHYRGAVAPA